MRLQFELPTPRRLLGDFVSLIYPNLCVACSRDVPASGSCFCYPCRIKMQSTDMHKEVENELTKRFWGRLDMQTGSAMYYFVKGGPAQRALHQLKYRDKPDIGVKIGREFGRLLRRSAHYEGIEIIVPVPLHPRKERMRGYNQSAAFAEGLSESLHIPFAPHALARDIFAESQTKKSRGERYGNIQSAFVANKPNLLEGKKVLLVDDVLTTGATLESCGNIILALPNTKLYVATIAIAMNH